MKVPYESSPKIAKWRKIINFFHKSFKKVWVLRMDFPENLVYSTLVPTDTFSKEEHLTFQLIFKTQI